MEDEEIEGHLKEAARDSKISCAAAQKIAIDYHVSMKRVGELLDRMKIKIIHCQLGCF